MLNLDSSVAFKDSNLNGISSEKIEEEVGIKIWALVGFFDFMSEKFSKPVGGSTNDYYATQYLSEFIKQMGFDGIKYKSSLKKGSHNIVLFDVLKGNGNSKNYEIVSSSLYGVKDVKITTEKILPL